MVCASVVWRFLSPHAAAQERIWYEKLQWLLLCAPDSYNWGFGATDPETDIFWAVRDDAMFTIDISGEGPMDRLDAAWYAHSFRNWKLRDALLKGLPDVR